jgi:hypothetical protein
LLPEKGNQAAAPQGRIQLGRGAVIFPLSGASTCRPGQANEVSAIRDP